MDQTILDSSDPYLFNRPDTNEAHSILKQKIREGLNWNVVNILRRAAELRPSKVSAIFLLTNNSSEILVSAVDEVLLDLTGSIGKYKTYRGNSNDRTMPDKSYFFDSIMMRQHTSRPKTIDDNPPKRLIDVLNMMKFMGLEGAGVESIKDVYFFDDIGTHNLRAEFNFMSDGKYKDHYIQINPPFHRYSNDITNYRPILNALSELDGKDATLPYIEPRTVIQQPRTFRIPFSGPLPSAPPPPPVPYRNRSGAEVNENKLGLPPPPQEQSIRTKAPVSRPPLMGAFSQLKTKGGSRKTRKRRRGSKKTRRFIKRK